ncbi:hypothetical protein M5D10_05045 [Leptospira santarosai]|uniref:hypothetical protein n=1 Tax=Leptospira santarosai TaxID=28183 RepID=UPI0022A947C5|nr:hypothetical protein [Leptospira santarosai]UZN08329.1 hypothetical protein M5D10_05045 [Leptospira santarosai]
MSQTGNSLGVSILKPFIESFFPYQETVINTGNLKLKVPHGHFWFSKSGRRGSRYARIMPIFFLREFRPNPVRTSCSNRRVFYLASYDEDGKRIEPKKSLTVEIAQ